MAAPIKFGVGQSVRRKEDDALIRGKGRYTDDVAPQPAMHALVLRSPHAHAKFTIDVSKARGLPGVGVILTAADVGDLGDLPCLFNLRSRSVHRSALSDPAEGRSAPCRRRRRLRRRRTHRPRPRRDRGDRRQMDAAAGGGRPRQCRQEGRAAGLARSCRQRAVRRFDRRQEGGRGGIRQGAYGRRDLDRQSAHRRQFHGNARGGRRIRRQERSPDPDDRQPGQPSLARHPVPERAEYPDREDAGDLPRRRRRLRHEAVSLPRIRAGRGRRAQTEEDGEMDRRPH